MVLPVGFFEPVRWEKPQGWSEACFAMAEGYFDWTGRGVKVVSSLDHYWFGSPHEEKLSGWVTALKIITLFTAIVPLFFLVVKAVFRQRIDSYKIVNEIVNEVEEPINFRKLVASHFKPDRTHGTKSTYKSRRPGEKDLFYTVGRTDEETRAVWTRHLALNAFFKKYSLCYLRTAEASLIELESPVFLQRIPSDFPKFREISSLGSINLQFLKELGAIVASFGLSGIELRDLPVDQESGMQALLSSIEEADGVSLSLFGKDGEGGLVSQLVSPQQIEALLEGATEFGFKPTEEEDEWIAEAHRRVSGVKEPPPSSDTPPLFDERSTS